MDPLSHLIFGPTLIKSLPSRLDAPRAWTTAALLGAIVPDFDAVFMPIGWDVYLKAHEIGTHSLLGSVPLAFLTAIVVRMFARRARPRGLLLASWIGCASHIALDVVSGARIQLGWPLVSGRTNVPLVAMADPYLIGIFAFAGVGLLVARRMRQRVAWTTLGLLTFFLGAKALLLNRAIATFDSRSSSRPSNTIRIAEASWGRLTEWHIFERAGAELRHWSIASNREPVLVLAWPAAGRAPLVDRSRELSTVRNFTAVHELTFAAQSPEATSHEATQVLWSDIRFCWEPTRDDGSVDLVHEDRDAGRRIACGLWFGGTFDSKGNPINELVLLGGWRQSRAPSLAP